MPKNQPDVIATNVFGDPSNTSFIGIYPRSEDNTVYVYLRCKQYSKALLLEEKVNKLQLKGASLTDEDRKELTDLLIESVKEKNETKKRLVLPNLERNVLWFTVRATNLVSMFLSEVALSNALMVRRVISDLENWTDFQKIKDYDSLIAAMDWIVANRPKVYKKILELDDQGNGVFE